MSDLDKPVVRKISQSHFSLVVPGWRVVRIDHLMLVVIRAVQIVDPGVRGRHRVKRVVCTWR